jgi:hypothetical protein
VEELEDKMKDDAIALLLTARMQELERRQQPYE